MSESKWIREKYAYHELKSSKIKSILYFGIVWSIFEKEVCNNNAKINNSSALSEQLVQNLDSISKRKISLIWNYFVDRYTTNGTIKGSFNNFQFNQNDNKDFVKSVLEKGNSADYQEKSEAILRIVFRLRNNLLHGGKDVSQLYEQNDNFKNANKFLMLFVDEQIRIN